VRQQTHDINERIGLKVSGVAWSKPRAAGVRQHTAEQPPCCCDTRVSECNKKGWGCALAAIVAAAALLGVTTDCSEDRDGQPASLISQTQLWAAATYITMHVLLCQKHTAQCKVQQHARLARAIASPVPTSTNLLGRSAWHPQLQERTGGTVTSS